MLGTVRLNNVYVINRSIIRRLLNCWNQPLEIVSIYVRLSRNLLKKHTLTWLTLLTVLYAIFSSYIVWKYKIVVTFYTNKLVTAPNNRTEEPSEHTRSCVDGLCKLKCWTGSEAMHKTEFDVPAVVDAYNFFMNVVDKFNQMGSTSLSSICEKRVTMSIFDFLFDASFHNAYAVMKAPRTDGQIFSDFREFRRLFASELTSKRTVKSKKKSLQLSAQSDMCYTSVACSQSLYNLLKNVGRRHVSCYMCKLRGIEKSITLKLSCA